MRMATLKQLMQQLCSELEMPAPEFDPQKKMLFIVNATTSVLFYELPESIGMQAKIVECPEKKREELFTYLMRANFLGQGTSGSRIGLDADEKFLTLSSAISYEINYRSFKESVEDFVNHVIYWREEIIRDRERIN